MAVTTAEVMEALPKGVIFPWVGTMALPKGWNVCDGTNGTPNLQGQFLRGAQGQEGVGIAGGSPSHQHKVAKDGGRDGRGFAVHGECGLGDADPQQHLPPFYAVHYIMKIR